AVHPRRVPLPAGRRPPDQLPHAPLEPAAPPGFLRRRTLARAVRVCPGGGLSLPVLRRRHARGPPTGLVTLRFEVDARVGEARAGTVTTARGSFSTPCFMPVGTRGSVRTLSAADLEDLGVELLLANTYHLMLRPGADVVSQLGGL